MLIKAVVRATVPAGQASIYPKTTDDQVIVSADIAELFDLPAVDTPLDTVLETIAKTQNETTSASAAWLGSSHLGAAFLTSF